MSFDAQHVIFLAVAAVAAVVAIVLALNRSVLAARNEALASEIRIRQAELGEYAVLQRAFAELKGQAEATQLAQRDEIAQLREKSAQLDALRQRHSGLEAESAEKEKSFSEQLRVLKEADASLKQNFENLAQRIFDEKSSRFKEQNKEQLDALLLPLTNEIKEFRQAHVQTTKEISGWLPKILYFRVR